MVTIMELSKEEMRLVYDAVRHWQMNKTAVSTRDYKTCSDLLDKLFLDVYTQRLEQPT